MKLWIGSMTALMLAGGALAAQQAAAGCGMPDMANLKPMVYRDDGRAGFIRADFRPWVPVIAAGITGLWKFEFVADGVQHQAQPADPPKGILVDSGFVSWHDDGTEIMNSGRAPVTGSFCEGVWRQTGPLTYRLNHWALSWVPEYQPGQTQSWSTVGGADQAYVFTGPTNITETVTLSRNGKSYSGSFMLRQYAPGPVNTNPADGPVGLNVTATGALEMTITGSISAARITAD